MNETPHNGIPHTVAAALHERFLDGELDVAGVSRLADHRALCLACDRSFAGVERLFEALSGLDRPEPRPGFAEGVLAELRPARVPLLARWRLAPVWARAAGAAALIGSAALVLALQLVVGPAVSDAGALSLLFRSPALLADGVLAILREIEPFQPLLDVGNVLAGALLSAAGSPTGITALGASALLSAAALRQIVHLVAVPGRGSALRGGRGVQLLAVL